MRVPCLRYVSGVHRYRSTSFLLLLCCLLWFGQQLAPLHVLSHAVADLHTAAPASAPDSLPDSLPHGHASCEQCLAFAAWSAALPSLQVLPLLAARFAPLAQRIPDSRYQVLHRAYLSRAPPISLV
jgi:hypothetical protein